MKNTFILLMPLTILFFIKSTEAQITINSSDLPVVNDTFRVSIGQAFTGMDATLTGANYNWDYTQLVATSQTIDTFVSVSSTGLYWLSFLNSSFALKSNTPAVSLGGLLTIDYEYDFFKKNSSSYVQTGFGARMNGFPLPVPYSPKDTIYRLPLHYNDMGSSSSAFSVTIPSLGYYGGNKTRTDTTDGWGTLITPYGTFATLRVKSVIDETDSIHVDTLFHFGISIPRPQMTEYKWLASGKGIPVLQINTIGGIPTQILYRDSIRNTNPLSVPMNQNVNLNFNVYPNPSAGILSIGFNLEKPAIISTDFFNVNGVKLLSTVSGRKEAGDNLLTIDLSEKMLTSGTYLVKLIVDGKIFQKQFVVEK